MPEKTRLPLVVKVPSLQLFALNVNVPLNVPGGVQSGSVAVPPFGQLVVAPVTLELFGLKNFLDTLVTSCLYDTSSETLTPVVREDVLAEPPLKPLKLPFRLEKLLNIDAVLVKLLS